MGEIRRSSVLAIGALIFSLGVFPVESKWRVYEKPYTMSQIWKKRVLTLERFWNRVVVVGIAFCTSIGVSIIVRCLSTYIKGQGILVGPAENYLVPIRFIAPIIAGSFAGYCYYGKTVDGLLSRASSLLYEGNEALMKKIFFSSNDKDLVSIVSYYKESDGGGEAFVESIDIIERNLMKIVVILDGMQKRSALYEKNMLMLFVESLLIRIERLRYLSCC